jgi:hypothetical protein
MLKDSVKVCVPLTKNAAGYPLTFTETTYKANARSGEFEIIGTAGKTEKANMKVLIEKAATIKASYQIEYQGTKHNIVKFEEAKDDNADRDHWIVWLT